MSTIRVFFPLTFDLHGSWRGGFNLMFGAVTALHEQGAEIEFLNIYQDIPEQPGLATVGSITRFANPESAKDYLDRFESKRKGSAVLFSLGHCGLWSIDLPRVIYIPDFQHEYYPENFQAEELRTRKLGYLVETVTADGVWMSSFSVQKDLDRFIPGAPKERLILPFPSLKPKEDPTVSYRRPVEQKYFLCVSQGWKHKNLQRLADAWKSVCDRSKDSGWRLVIIGTQLSEAQSLNPQCIELKNVSETDLGLFYRHAEFFVLPSDFEGWSTPVEEAIAHRLPLALSDISILREQAPKGAVFFDQQRPESIAEVIEKLIADPSRRQGLCEEITALRRMTKQQWGHALAGFLTQVAD